MVPSGTINVLRRNSQVPLSLPHPRCHGGRRDQHIHHVCLKDGNDIYIYIHTYTYMYMMCRSYIVNNLFLDIFLQSKFLDQRRTTYKFCTYPHVSILSCKAARAGAWNVMVKPLLLVCGTVPAKQCTANGNPALNVCFSRWTEIISLNKQRKWPKNFGLISTSSNFVGWIWWPRSWCLES